MQVFTKSLSKFTQTSIFAQKSLKKFIKTIVTGHNILYNTFANADTFDVQKNTTSRRFLQKNDNISQDFPDSFCLEIPHPAWYDRFYKMRQLRFVKGDCVQMLISGYYGFRVESKNAFAFR